MFVVNVEDGPNQMWRMAPIKGYPSNRLSMQITMALTLAGKPNYPITTDQ